MKIIILALKTEALENLKSNGSFLDQIPIKPIIILSDLVNIRLLCCQTNLERIQALPKLPLS